MSDEKVLLVDDEQDFVDALSTRMESRGLSVESAGSGPEALEKIAQKRFDAVILDMVMPGMDGMETLKKMLEKNPELQVILLTGHATVEKGVQAVKLGAVDFLEKPAKIEDLMEKIKKAKVEKAVLVEKKMQAKMNDILKNKGW